MGGGGGKREEVRGMRWEEEGEKDKCLAVITQQVRYDLYNNTRAGDSCFTTEPTTYNTCIRGSIHYLSM